MSRAANTAKTHFLRPLLALIILMLLYSLPTKLGAYRVGDVALIWKRVGYEVVVYDVEY